MAAVLALLLPVWLGASKRPARSAKTPASPTRVLLLGIDSADWQVIRPLLDAGRMPNLARLLQRSASGPLTTILPLTKSPVIWTTIATGKTPQKHGVNDFLTGTLPTTSNQWQAKPVWEILGSAGRTVQVVSWWITWPAQPVNGVLVSDYIGYARGLGQHQLADQYYPASAGKIIEPLVRDPKAVPTSELRHFFLASPDSVTLPTEGQNLIEQFKFIYAADQSVQRIALALYRANRPDLCAVYFRGVDEVSHLFWNYWHSENLAPGGSRPLLASVFGEMVPRYYAWTDSLIGDLLRATDDRTTVVVCSDHGFRGGRSSLGVSAHREEGVIAVSGRGVRAGTLSGAQVYDVTPTVLAMFGLPRANDMDGVVLSEALDPSVFPPVVNLLATYETGPRTARGTSAKPVKSPVDEELKERLKSLGYINK